MPKIRRYALSTLDTVASLLHKVILRENIHVIEANQALRSAQLAPKRLEQLILQYGIQTILNLRGNQSDKMWYQNQIALIKRLKVVQHDIPLPCNEFIQPTMIDHVLSIMEQAQRPILIHCKRGADRTGLIAALYRAWFTKATPEKALEELSIRYGHTPFFGHPTRYLKKSYYHYISIKMKNRYHSPGYENPSSSRHRSISE